MDYQVPGLPASTGTWYAVQIVRQVPVPGTVQLIEVEPIAPPDVARSLPPQSSFSRHHAKQAWWL